MNNLFLIWVEYLEVSIYEVYSPFQELFGSEAKIKNLCFPVFRCLSEWSFLIMWNSVNHKNVQENCVAHRKRFVYCRLQDVSSDQNIAKVRVLIEIYKFYSYNSIRKNYLRFVLLIWLLSEILHIHKTEWVEWTVRRFSIEHYKFLCNAMGAQFSFKLHIKSCANGCTNSSTHGF